MLAGRHELLVGGQHGHERLHDQRADLVRWVLGGQLDEAVGELREVWQQQLLLTLATQLVAEARYKTQNKQQQQQIDRLKRVKCTRNCNLSFHKMTN